MYFPNSWLADNGSGYGPDVVTIYGFGIDPNSNADAEGNFVKARSGPGVPYHAIVTPSFGTTIAENGTEQTVTGYTVMLYTYENPNVYTGCFVDFEDLELEATTDAGRVAGGAYAFTAKLVGPDPASVAAHP